MRICVVLALTLSMTICAAVAAETPKITMDAQNMTLEEAMADAGKQSGVQILCDADAKGIVSGQFNSIELEKFLDAVTKSSGLSWQKLYLPVQPDQKLTPQQIRARAAAVSAVLSGTIIVCDPATGKQKVFVEQDAAAPSVDPAKLGMTALYLVSKPNTEAADSQKDTASKLQSLQNERLKLMAEMAPEQRVEAMQQEMLGMLYLDPQTRQQMMVDQMNARRNMDPQMREAYQDMMRESFRSMREQGLIPQDGRQRGTWGNRTGDGTRQRPDGGTRDRTRN